MVHLLDTLRGVHGEGPYLGGGTFTDGFFQGSTGDLSVGVIFSSTPVTVPVNVTVLHVRVTSKTVSHCRASVLVPTMVRYEYNLVCFTVVDWSDGGCLLGHDGFDPGTLSGRYVLVQPP